jgi:type III restriction enzyme
MVDRRFEIIPYQQAAIDAVCGVFSGQPKATSHLSLPSGQGPLFGGTGGFGNRLVLGPEQLLANVRAVQQANVPRAVDDSLSLMPNALGEADPMGGTPQLSLEMETGTGKTYVYLATMRRLARDFGFRKFIIVVPSVAIREGVLTAVQATAEHLQARFGGAPLRTWAHSRRELHRVRSFGLDSEPQCLILNIQAFDKEANLLNQSHDDFAGQRPIDFLRATRPIVILDEPQNLDGPSARRALASLAPTCALRYSATHRERHNQLYRFGPVEAFDGGWVKAIEVDSVVEEDAFNRPHVEVLSVASGARGPSARLEVEVEGASGPARKKVSVKDGADLEAVTKRSLYAGWRVSFLDAGAGEVEFANGEVLCVGDRVGVDRDALMKVQIRRTVEEHLRKVRRMRRRPVLERMKVLSLFFIDKVAHYANADGKLRRWFEEAYVELSEGRFKALDLPPVEAVHAGYFAQDKKGVAKDTKGTTEADARVYELIMKKKDELLDQAVPLQFLFSHSALREGWDNPNVFQLCMLNESRTTLRKRQEIGRGLRLPVMANGERCRDRQVARLTVVANESYDDFARKLQSEIAEETGEDFGGRTVNVRERKTVTFRDAAGFDALWSVLAPQTSWAVGMDSDELIAGAAAAVGAMAAVKRPQVVARRASLRLSEDGVQAVQSGSGMQQADEQPLPIPDLLAELQRRTDLSRHTLARILIDSGRLGEASNNPQRFVQRTAGVIEETVAELLARRVTYGATGGAWDSGRFEPDFDVLSGRWVATPRGLYDGVEVDSEVERRFAEALNERSDVALFCKLPRWYRIPTPVGAYNPDWALLMADGRVLVRETKDTAERDELPPEQRRKVLCGEAHYAAIGVDYAVVSEASQVF